MGGDLCLCLVEFMGNSGSSITTILELGFVLFIIGLGIAINLKFKTKLHDEKKQMPINRRGNVVGSVMSVFCRLQMVFWPCDLILLWGITNEIVPVDSIHPNVCLTLLMTVKTGRMCISYHSLFVALIRYMHIVRHKILNQWNYERVANYFKFFCIIFPLVMEGIGNFTNADLAKEFAMIGEIRDCMGFTEKLNDGITKKEEIPFKLVQWTLNYLPAHVVQALSSMYTILTVLVSVNVIEAYLYLRIFQTMERTNRHSFQRGVLNRRSFEVGNKRRLATLNICFLSWLLEFIGIGVTFLTPILLASGAVNIYFIDAILMFVMLPAMYLINDEDIKTVITEQGWIQGIMNTFVRSNQIQHQAPVAGH